MGARRRRINKERLGIFGGWGAADDEESGGSGKATRAQQLVYNNRRSSSRGSSRELQIGGVPLAVWIAWAAVALVVFLIVKFQYLLE
jgi:hypothetical protein